MSRRSFGSPDFALRVTNECSARNDKSSLTFSNDFAAPIINSRKVSKGIGGPGGAGLQKLGRDGGGEQGVCFVQKFLLCAADFMRHHSINKKDE
jgi:hypothetical protein